MNTFTFFALLICAIVAMVGAVPSHSQPAVEAHEAPIESLETAESRGYGHGHHGHGHHGHDHHGHGNHGHNHHGHHGGYGR